MFAISVEPIPLMPIKMNFTACARRSSAAFAWNGQLDPVPRSDLRDLVLVPGAFADK
jgi:hypothetical protein